MAPTTRRRIQQRISHHIHTLNDNWLRTRLSFYWLSAIIVTLSPTVISGADCLTSISSSNGAQVTNQDRVSVLRPGSSGLQTIGNSGSPSSVIHGLGALGISGSSINGFEKHGEKFRQYHEEREIDVKENTPIGSKLTEFRPNDSAQSLFAIIGGADQNSFSLLRHPQENKAELVNEINFDYENTKKKYHVIVRATSIYSCHDVEYVISVTDENDNKPQLENFAIVFNNYKNNFPTAPIGRVPATDADVNDQLRYRVMSGNDAQLVVVNETNGDIQLSPWLNGNVPVNTLLEIAVSDGLNEHVALVVFTVNLVTESMLQNSIVLRLDGIGRDEFLNKKYDIFLEAMQRVLGLSHVDGPNQVVLFDVEESILPNELSSNPYSSYQQSQTPGNITVTSLSFSVRSDKNGIESYYPSQYIEERIHMARLQLSRALGVEIAPFQDNLCVSEPCLNYQECRATYKFDKAPKSSITTSKMIFRPIRASQSYMCTCPHTYTGLKLKSDCNIQINQCLSKSPCLNDGICHMHENGFVCECMPGFIGSRCEHSFTNSTCESLMINELESVHLGNGFVYQPPSCSGKSKCTNTNKSYFNSNPKAGIASSSQSVGFSCQGCSHPQWSTPLCQLKARSFAKNSYVTLPGLRRRHKFTLSLRFATFQTDALILYNGRYNDKHDFLSLEIINSNLKMSYSLRSSVNSVTLPSINVSNGNWHTVTIIFKDRNATLLIDDCDPMLDEGLARIHGGSFRRCSNTSFVDSSVIERTLDLTGPLQLGSLLPINIEFPINSPGFVGCMSDIYLDHQIIDLYNPIQEINTQPGCQEKRNFCKDHSCNNHPCQESWGSAKCLCGEGNIGRSCEISLSNEKVKRFNGNSYSIFNPIESSIRPTWQVSLHFRTINPNGILMKVLLDSDSSIIFELSNGGLRISHRLQNMTYVKTSLDDGEWHYLELVWASDFAQLQIDYNPFLTVQSTDMGSISGSTIKMVTMGASQTPKSGEGQTEIPPEIVMNVPNLQPEEYLSVFSPANNSQSFVGCIYGVNISDNTENWLLASDERNVERGCQSNDPCEVNPCPSNSRCTRRGINQRKCVCNLGHIGDRCIPICDLNPCQGEGSRCIQPNPMSSDQVNTESIAITQAPNYQPLDYYCECEPFRAGKNCEHLLQQRCLSNWWGGKQPGSNSSICYPCNCDESKGFNGDCDKVTGKCICKQDHYQPPGSDQCLPCNCYQDGSARSRSCSAETGQCKCRQGVVGRRCDTCAHPYSQVTVRGCEVVYDGCPKTFSDGVWWDKTALDKLAVQQCPPSTSTGTATRFCHKTNGWEKPNMFDCISNLFTDLFNEYKVFEENKFNMKSNLAMKIASNLRQALNETISNPSLQLYGSDMFISFRLIHHLIQFESQQIGINLTHLQDRMYIRNIIESISYILDPAYEENWPEILKRSPYVGPEYLVKLLDIYAKRITESPSCYFSQPFEINSPFLTFGMEKVSSDYNRESNNPLLSSNFGSPPYATDPLGPASNSAMDNHVIDNSLDIIQEQQVKAQDSTSVLVIPRELSQIGDSLSDETTRVVIPLNTLRVRLMPNEPTSSFYETNLRVKRDESIIPDLKSPRQKPALVVYSIFRSLGSILPQNFDTTVHRGQEKSVSSNSPVIWLTIRPANSSEILSRNIKPKINYVLKINETQGKTRPQCAVWDFTSPITPVQQTNLSSSFINKPFGTGKFSTKGCQLVGVQHNPKFRLRYDSVNCSCDHVGAVTVLMDNANFEYLIGEEHAKKYSSIMVATCLSLVILTSIYFILAFVKCHSVKSNSNSINKNLIIILMLIEIIILYSVVSRSNLSQMEYQCKLVAVFLHYLSLSLFFWLFVNAVHFYRMLTELKDINHGPMKFYHVVGYAVPAVFVSVAVGLRIEQFGNNHFCWLSTNEPIIWSMFGPISVSVCATILLFLMALCKSLPVKDPSGAELLKNHMMINIFKTPIIAFYWLVTVYVVNETFYLDWTYLYPLITIVKSICLFVLLCIVDKHIRFNIYVTWLRFKGKEIPFLEDPANQISNQWLHTIGDDGTMNKNYPAYGTGPAMIHQVTTPGFQSPYDDIFPQDILGFSAASTTSRSTATGTSSSVYQHHRDKVDYGRSGNRSKSRRRHKKTHHKHHHHKRHHRDHHHHYHRSHRHQHEENDHYQGESHYDRRRNNTAPVSNHRRNEEYLASSHSSDEEDSTMIPKIDIHGRIQKLESNPNQGDEQTQQSTNGKQTVPMELIAGPSDSKVKLDDTVEDSTTK